MGLNYITSNGITPGGREVGLEPPTTFTRIVGDGNCLFRALAHIITGSEEQHMAVYTYHEDTKNWNRYSPNAVERSLDESNISERGMYIRLARSHFDVVSSVNNQ